MTHITIEIGGKCTSWADLESLSTHCRKAGISLHMDGARLWEATGALGESLVTQSAGTQGSTRESLCQLFDSLYVSFYKGLGGVTGAMLVGSHSFIEEARIWNRRFGGNVYSLFPLAVSCWAGFKDNKDTFKTKKERLQEIVKLLSDTFIDQSKRPRECCDSAGNPLVRFDPPVPQVSMIHVYVRCDAGTAMKVREEVLAATGVSCFTRIRPAPHTVYTESYFEMNLVCIYFVFICYYFYHHCTNSFEIIRSLFTY